MSRKKYFIDIHALQTVPPSCVNRDDTGAPKSCQYGGVPRARVSSQCWKRAVRTAFPEEYLGIRTKKVPELVRGRIMELDRSVSEDEAAGLTAKVLEAAGAGMEKAKKGEKTDVLKALMFLSDMQADALARQALLDSSDKKAAEQALKDRPTADIAMFGRMVASNADLNVDACVQVAHAISTHTVHTEYDYFTAVDEMNKESETGAGHVDTAEFCSAVLYRYACVDVAGLYEVLGKEAAKAVAVFVRCFLTSMPSGKSNSFANFTLPGYVRLCVRESAPMSFAGAFERPVKSDGGGFFEPSVEALGAYAADIQAKYGAVPRLELGFNDGGLDVILDRLENDITAVFSGGGDVV